MGTDKALIGHPDGGSWLVRSLGLLNSLGAPITVCSADPVHHQAVRTHAASNRWPAAAVSVTTEPQPGRGPLNALHHLMLCHPGELLLLCAVDMPWLQPATLSELAAAGRRDPAIPQVATDEARLHPLLAVYPASEGLAADLGSWLATGARSMHGWLQRQRVGTVSLPPEQLRNCNHPDDWAPWHRPAGVGPATPTAGCRR